MEYCSLTACLVDPRSLVTATSASSPSYKSVTRALSAAPTHSLPKRANRLKASPWIVTRRAYGVHLSPASISTVMVGSPLGALGFFGLRLRSSANELGEPGKNCCAPMPWARYGFSFPWNNNGSNMNEGD